MNRTLSCWLALVVAVLLSGCSDLARLIAPAGAGDSRPARVSFTASVVSSNTRSAADIVSLRVTTSYVLTGGRRDTIGSQSLALTSAASQAVPIPVDLAGCLADSKRDGATVDAGCSVVLELALSVNGVVVDRQTVGPLRLSPGATTEVRQPVMLFEIASVSITPTGSLLLTVGGTASITPTVRDTRGQPVDGRPVTWESDNPTVAGVDVNGRVSAVSVGQARISATLGALSSSVLVQVSRPPVSLVISPAVGSGTGVVRSAPSGIDCRIVNGAVTGVCAFDFAADLQVTLSSTADAGQQFVAWGGACVGSAIGVSCSLTMTQPRIASAQFTALRRVTITSTGTDGRGRVSGGFGLDCVINGALTSGTCAVDVPEGSSIVLSSVPDAANAQSVLQVFSGWGNDCTSASGATCALTVSGNRTASAGFFAGRFLNITIDGSGGGSVASVSGIACASAGGRSSGVCAQTFPFGTGVTLFPVGDAQSSFVGWGGACAGQALAMCTLSISESREARATFVRRLIPLTLTLSGSGNGTVTVNGVVGCARSNTQVGAVTCVREFEPGAMVTVQATAGLQTDFESNSGDCVGSAPCLLVMSTARVVNSRFAGKGPMRLSIEALGASGSGVVRSAEATPLIDCHVINGVSIGGNCAITVPAGTVVSLRAIGDEGNALSFWGAGCNGRTTHECVLVMDVPLNVFVGFTPAVDVDLRLSGSGLGTVTFQPSDAPTQAPCVVTVSGTPVSCRYSLPFRSSGVFRATPEAGGRFDGFVGPCVESSGSTAVPVCTYRGIGFLRVISGIFTAP